MILIALNILLFIVELAGVFSHKPRFYQSGLLFFKNTITVKNINLIEHIGNQIRKDDVSIKVIDENKIVFYSDTKSAVEHLFTYKIILNILFGECDIADEHVTIKYKIPLSLLVLFLTSIFYLIYKDMMTLPILIFFAVIIGFTIFLQYLKFKNIQNDLEDFIRNGK